jgi:iron complex outermembrane receptor protein
MKRRFLYTLLYIGGLTPALASETEPADTLHLYDLKEVVVTATRIPQELMDIPQRVDVVSLLQLRATPTLSAIDGMQAVAGANIRQPRGLFSRNTLVSLRGMGTEQGRTLVMIDGAPLNKSSTGSINLNRLNPERIERIEVVKGPGSSLYGGSAMGGVVNYLTCQPREGMHGSCQVRWGEMGTYATQFALGGRTDMGRSAQGYLLANGFYQKSDGYLLTPAESRSATDIATFLHEYALSALAGLDLGKRHLLEAEVRYYKGTRGQGTRYFLDDAATAATDTTRRHVDLTMQFREQDYRLRYRATLGGLSLQASAFYSREDYVELKTKNTSLYDVDCLREDWDVKLYGYGSIGEPHLLSGGLEVKGGYVDGRDVYRTTTDRVMDRGHSLLFGAWVQDEWTLAEGRIRIVPSLRLDHARIYDGGFFIYDGTDVTALYAPYTGELADNSWTALSPKLSVQYSADGRNRVFATTGWGFRPGNLEDMVRVGPAPGGMTLGNTALRPEHIWSLEVGADVTLWAQTAPLTLSPSVYYSRGRDFIYNVNTGDSILMNGRQRPIYAMKNLARVNIAGAECDVRWAATPTLTLTANASYTHSEVRSGEASVSGVTTDLKGRLLTYVPRYKVAVGLTWRNPLVPFTLSYVRYGRQYTNDLNTAWIRSYGTVDAKLWRALGGGRAVVSLNAQNLLDKQLNIGGEMTLGRMIFGELVMRF